MMKLCICVAIGCSLSLATWAGAQSPARASTTQPAPTTLSWNQWRGPARDGQVPGPAWPDKVSGDAIKPIWRRALGPSYSGPIVTESVVFVTETKDKKIEVVRALDRRTGDEVWHTQWDGALSVPFFAKANGDWIRATPAFDGQSLFVAGMRDLLVSLDAKTGREQWRIDFIKEYQLKPPDFGMVCSPLVDSDALYVQAANSLLKIDKASGRIIWRALMAGGGMAESGAFSSPVIAQLAGKRQIVAQTRELLAGVDLENGNVLWSQKVPAYRGMNILTPVVFEDSVFTSSYQNRSWLYKISKTQDGFEVKESWSNTAQGYMSTPVVIGGHAYMQLANQRYGCINLKTGERVWTSSKGFGKYASLVARGDKILALDERGILLLIQANPKEFRLIDERKVSEEDTWAHLALSGNELFVRELNALAVYQWEMPN